MSDAPLVSIVVPMYNSAPYIGRCVDTLQAQTYNNIEIILVNDGSTDDTLLLAQQYEKTDPRIRVVDQPNGGSSSARNAGLQVGSGEYFLFVDADDFLENNAVEHLVNVSNQSQLDMLMFGIKMDYVDEGFSVEKSFSEAKIATKPEEIQHLILESCHNGLLYSPCNKLYSASVIRDHKLQFLLKEEPIEDILFNCLCMQFVQRIGVMQESFYHYIKENKESAVTQYRENLWSQSEKRSNAITDLFSFWNIDFAIHKGWLQQEYVGGKSDCISNMYRKGAKKTCKQKKKEVQKYIFNNDRFWAAVKVISERPLPFDQKVLVALSRICNAGMLVVFYNLLFWCRYHLPSAYFKFRRNSMEKTQ